MSYAYERPDEDIFYDLNPFVAAYQCDCGRIKNHIGLACEFCNTICRYTGDMNARYKGEEQNQITREHFFGEISQDYYDSIMELISMNLILRRIHLGSRFLISYTREIVNRLCLECEFVREIEIHPERYRDYELEDVIQPITDFLGWLLNTCRFGRNTVEKMIDTVEQEIIDEYHDELSKNCAALLLAYIASH